MEQTTDTTTSDEGTSLPTGPTNGASNKKLRKTLASKPDDVNDAQDHVERRAASEPTADERKLEREVVTADEQRVADPPPPPAPAKTHRVVERAAPNPVNIALQKLKNATDIEAYEWMAQIGGEAEMQVQVIRREPESFVDPRDGQRKKTSGQVATYTRKISEKEIQEKHGGGTYQFQIKTKNDKGQWQYFGSRTVEIAGDPMIDDVPRQVAGTNNQTAPTVIAQPDTTASRALDQMVSILGSQLNRPSSPTGPSSVEIANMINQSTGPLLRQIELLTTQLAAKDEALVAARTAPPDAFRDKMLSSLMDNESARILALRTQYDSEIRSLKENFADTEKRLRDQFARDTDRLERAHERELNSLKMAYDSTATASKATIEVQKTVLEAEVSRLRTEIAEAKAEVKHLTAIKNPSIKDKVEELETIKNLVGGDDEGEKGTLATVMEVLGNLPVVAQLADKLTGPGEKTVQQPQLQQAPTQPQKARLVRGPDGNVYAATAQGMMPVKRKGSEVTNDQGKTVEIPPIDPESLKTAINFMEGAYKNGTDPKTFADGARPFIGPSMLQAMRTLGISDFLTKVAKLEGTSNLLTMGGRNWCKKVANHLIEGGPGANDDAPVPPAVDPPPQE